LKGFFIAIGAALFSAANSLVPSVSASLIVFKVSFFSLSVSTFLPSFLGSLLSSSTVEFLGVGLVSKC
jgi:hypothetical protein